MLIRARQWSVRDVVQVLQGILRRAQAGAGAGECSMHFHRINFEENDALPMSINRSQPVRHYFTIMDRFASQFYDLERIDQFFDIWNNRYIINKIWEIIVFFFKESKII